MVVAEVKFCEIAVQMLLRTELVDAPHSSFEDRKEAFDGVGMSLANDIFADLMPNHAMRSEHGANVAIDAVIVGHDHEVHVQVC